MNDRIPEKSLSDEAKAVLLAHSWPGKVRSLQNEMSRATIIVEGDVIGANDLSFFGKAEAISSTSTKIEDIIRKISRLKEVPKIDDLYAICMRYVIGYTLEENEFSKERTARFLGVNANTLSSRISTYFSVTHLNRGEIEFAIAQWNEVKIDIPELPFLEEIVREVIRGKVASTNCVGEIDNIFYRAKIYALKESLIENNFVQAYAAKSLGIHATTVSKFIKENPELKAWIDKQRSGQSGSSMSLQAV
jgi:transcriptional regulator with GAF, ATPase, and Fis domain